MEKNPHHLILGELTDYLTEETLADTHDERLRQKIVRHLVDTCGFDKKTDHIPETDIHTNRAKDCCDSNRFSN